MTSASVGLGASAAAPRQGSQLRWRLVVAFLSVSVLPVLAASYVAATWITSQFDDRLELWLEDAGRFFAQSLQSDQIEASRAAAILAASLEGKIDDVKNEPLALYANLLASVGYDFVLIYGADGTVVYQFGQLDTTDWLPKKETASFFPVSSQGKVSLTMGATKSFTSNGRTYFAFVADSTSEEALEIVGADTSLKVQVLTVRDGHVARSGGHHVRLPSDARLDKVVAELSSGRPSLAAQNSANDDLALGYAALNNAEGKLVGIVVCRLAEQLASSTLVRTLPMFLALSLLAGLLSLAVALVLSSRIARPIKALTAGVRHIAAGDYQARVTEEGGRELAELAGGFNAMATNLDRLHKLEAEMRRREQFAALGEAAASIAHEIRNPLGIIKTSTEVVRMKAPLGDDSNRLIGFVLEEVDRIDRLVQDLLDYVRPKEADKLPLDLHRDVILRVLEFAAPELERRGVSQALSAAQGDTPILGDRRRLHEAFLNIVINALDAMPDGGALTVTVRRQDGEAWVEIEDTGAGVPAVIRDRVFDPFVTAKPRGTGLGLAKVRSVVDQHDGQIDFRTEDGAGTTFTLRFPLCGQDKP